MIYSLARRLVISLSSIPLISYILKEPAAYLYTASVSPASAITLQPDSAFSLFRSSSRTYLTFCTTHSHARHLSSFPSLFIFIDLFLPQNLRVQGYISLSSAPFKRVSVKDFITYSTVVSSVFLLLFNILSSRQLSSSEREKSLAATYFPAVAAVSSALEGLTSVFGMGTGISPPLWPPGIISLIQGLQGHVPGFSFPPGFPEASFPV